MGFPICGFLNNDFVPRYVVWMPPPKKNNNNTFNTSALYYVREKRSYP